MKLLLDTTYFLPIIGISVKNIPRDAPIKLVREGHEIFISNITIFELSAKAVKYVTCGVLPPQRVSKGIRAIIYDETINTIQIHESTILLTAFKLRNMLSDFIDCIILSSAINHCDTLVTEDNDIHNIKGNNSYREILMAKNPKFKIQRLAEIL